MRIITSLSIVIHLFGKNESFTLTIMLAFNVSKYVLLLLDVYYLTSGNIKKHNISYKLNLMFKIPLQ